MVAAVIGKNYQTTMTFRNEDGTPFEVSKPISYKVYSFDNQFILENVATQSSTDLSIWTASFAIPEQAPVPNDINNEQYWIEWFATGLNGEQLNGVEKFQVIGETEPPIYDSTVICALNTPVIDTLLSNQPIVYYNLSIQDSNSTVYYSYENQSPTSTLRNNVYITRFSSETAIEKVTDQSMGMFPYVMIYNIEFEDGSTETEIHNLYIMNNFAMVLINNMRRYVDMARLYDIDPDLRLTEEDYLHFITVGIQRFNAVPPAASYTLSNFPQASVYVLEKLAEHELLNAYYVALSSREFNFSGASVTLDVWDQRKSAIEKKMDEIGSWLDSNLKSSKEGTVRTSSSAGVLGIQTSSVTNGYSLRYPGQLRGILRRY